MIEGVPLRPGELLAGKYRVERVLGAGGMGVVVAATHVELDERVAIKVLRKEALSHESARERFLQEARAVVKIKTEHVARVFDVGVLADGTPYIVMEYLEGCDLAALLCAERRLPIEDAASYVVQACDAVTRAHALGIVHRDLKPANLFLATREGGACIKVLDFGISKSLEGGGAVTETSAVMGSPIYMSPEQLESSRDVDARSDVWSLGVILYELLTGAQPFVAPSLPQLCKMITDRPAPSLRSQRGEVPPELEAIVARCLSKKREERFASAQDLAAALAPFASPDARSAPPSVVRALSATALPSTPPTPRTFDDAQTRRRARGRSHVTLAIAGAALLAASLGVVGVARAPKREPAAAPPAPPASAALAAPNAILACPQLSARGVEEPSGWLGAAAAALACLRAQMWMGGRTDRTLVPAELLELPREAVHAFPRDPYDAPDARDRELAAAAARASAYVDGEVQHRSLDFAVTLTLKSPQGRELDRGEGTGPTLLEAVRAAMEPLLRSRAIPRALDGDPVLVEWYGSRTPEAATALMDLTVATLNEADALQARECARSRERGDWLPSVAYLVKDACDETGGVERAAPPLDESSRGALMISAMPFPSDPDDRRARAAALEAAAADEPSAMGRALLLGHAAFLTKRRESRKAYELAARAVHEDAKAFGLLNAVPRRAILFTSIDRASATYAYGAWVPFEGMPYGFVCDLEQDLEAKVRWSRRSFYVSGDGFWATDFADTLLIAGRREEAATVIAHLRGDGMRLALDASYAHFGLALADAGKLLAAKQANDADAMDAFRIAAKAAEVARILGRPAPFADTVLARYVDVERPFVGTGVLPNFQLALACMLAPDATRRRCASRIHDLRAKGSIAEGFVELSLALDGLEPYAKGDYRAAVNAWRPLFRMSDWVVTAIAMPLADALERAGETELLEDLDARILARPGFYNGADPAFVRAALRAEKKGDKEAARRLARTVMAAWNVADEVPPAVDEMRKLLARVH